MDTISRLSSIYIHIAPNSIRYTLTTIYYPSCWQISTCYISRVQSYSQRIYIQQSNWFIFNHFGHYFQLFQFIFILHQIQLYTLTTIHYPSCQQISVVITYECNVIHKEFIYSYQIGSFLTILDTISRLSSIYIHIAPNSIRYTLTTIYYPSCWQISVCYHLRVQCYSQRIYIQQSNWFIFNHFGHYFQIIFNLYSCCTKFNAIPLTTIIIICSTNLGCYN